MFLAFIQKKGWLQAPRPTGHRLPLATLGHLQRIARSRATTSIATGCNSSTRTSLTPQHGNRPQNSSVIDRLVGSAPYLNGGLFEEDDDDKRDDIVVPDTSINLILSRAIRPLQLHRHREHAARCRGRDRPRDARQGLRGTGHRPPRDRLLLHAEADRLLHVPRGAQGLPRHRPAGRGPRRHPAASSTTTTRRHPRPGSCAGSAAASSRACDPACGSGAYLLGLLHELLELRQALFSDKQVDPISNYNRKLEIIQNNIYGVDIDPFAVNIARLRLWLSLAVEYDGTTRRRCPTSTSRSKRATA